MMKPELFDDFLCPRSPAPFDQHEISGHRYFTQKVGGF